jgi:hypothetical protein
VAIIALLWFAFDRVIVENDGTLATGFVNNLGDLPFHIGIVSGFAYGQNYPPENPIFAGSGVLISVYRGRGDGPVRPARRDDARGVLRPEPDPGLALVGLLQRFAAALTGDRLASFIAPLIVLFSGGLGGCCCSTRLRSGKGAWSA